LLTRSFWPTAQGAQRFKVSSTILELVVLSAPRHVPSRHVTDQTLTRRSRQAIQKYIKANNTIGSVSDNTYKGHVNRAIVKGEETGIFLRPKGMFRTFPPSRTVGCFGSTRLTSARLSMRHGLPRNSPFMSLTILLGASGTVKLAKKDAKEPAAAKAEPKAEKKAAAPKAKKATTTVRIT
jgi:histone H1/5